VNSLQTNTSSSSVYDEVEERKVGSLRAWLSRFDLVVKVVSQPGSHANFP
jgi:hypothetical protein